MKFFQALTKSHAGANKKHNFNVHRPNALIIGLLQKGGLRKLSGLIKISAQGWGIGFLHHPWVGKIDWCQIILFSDWSAIMAVLVGKHSPLGLNWHML